MSLAVEYRDADFDMDQFFDKTTSWPDGLHEAYRFLPHLPRTVRRTNSVDDIQRYKDHFSLAQKNQGKFFTWKHYLKILGDDLRHFDTLILMSKIMVKRLPSPAKSEISNYVTASESESSQTSLSACNELKERSFIKEEANGDNKSISTVDNISVKSNVFLTPQRNVLKKMCTEIRQLARKTRKTVGKMSKKSKVCSGCGDNIGNIKAHKKCSEAFVEAIGYKEPIAASIIKYANLARENSVSSSSLNTAANGCGEFPTNLKPENLISPPHSSRKMDSFIKGNPMDIIN